MKPLTNINAKKLAGSKWWIHERLFQFNDYGRNNRGVTPWHAGREGIAYPLLNAEGKTSLYLKTFKQNTEARRARTDWLINQSLVNCSDRFTAAPFFWVDTQEFNSPENCPFNFEGYLSKAAQGESWEELRLFLDQKSLNAISMDVRLLWVEHLIETLALLEKLEICHGDLSPNNIILTNDSDSGIVELTLIDFDAFVPQNTPSVPEFIPKLEGGTYGTDGYCPKDLCESSERGEDAIPYSDKFGRDALILELLLYTGQKWMVNQPSSNWDRDRLKRRLVAKQKSCSPKYHALFEYLNQQDLFDITENERLSSINLAESVTIEVSDLQLSQTTTAPPIDFVPIGRRGKDDPIIEFDIDDEDQIDHRRSLVTDHQTRGQSELQRIIANIDDMQPLLAIGILALTTLILGIFLVLTA